MMLGKMKTYNQSQHSGPKKSYKSKGDAETQTISSDGNKKLRGIERRIENIHVGSLLKSVGSLAKVDLNEENTNNIALGVHLASIGKNVCFYGLGRKETHLRDKILRLQETHSIIFAKGNYSDVLPRTMFLRILEIAEKKRFEQSNIAKSELDDDAEKLAILLFSTLSRAYESKFLLVIFGIDGPNFFRKSVLESLAILTQLPNFNVIFTLDSVNFPFLLTRNICDRLNLFYVKLNSRSPYCYEMLYIDAIVDPKQETRSLSMVMSIINSLTPNQQELVKFVLQSLLFSEKRMIEERELFTKCLWEAKVTSFMQFGENLREALTHKLLIKKTVDCLSNIYLTPLSQRTLEAILDIKKEDSGDSDINEQDMSDDHIN